MDGCYPRGRLSDTLQLHTYAPSIRVGTASLVMMTWLTDRIRT